MNDPEFQLRGLTDPRLAVHATRALAQRLTKRGRSVPRER